MKVERGRKLDSEVGRPGAAQGGIRLITGHELWPVLPAAFAAAAILAADILSPLQGAIAVLYTIPILLLAGTGRRTAIYAGGAGCATLTVAAFIVAHRGDPFDGAYARFAVSLFAIASTTILSIRNGAARTTLAEQARILELTHDTVVICDTSDIIVYWNDGAEALYGWTRQEAQGKPCQRLLQTDYDADAVRRTLEDSSQWSGEFTRSHRDGSRIMLQSRWMARRNSDGRTQGIIETSADITGERRARADIQKLEHRYATIFQAAGFAIWESDWAGVLAELLAVLPADADPSTYLADHLDIVRTAAARAVVRDANRAAASLLGLENAETLVASSLINRYTETSIEALATIYAGLLDGARMIELETQFMAASGRRVDVVLRVTPLLEGETWSRILVMALDVTERNEARAKIEQNAAELAHAARVSTLGQLAASIAHEVNQPLAAIITYGNSGKRWLKRTPPDLGEVATSLDHMVANGTRAANVIAKVRSLAKKAAPEASPINLVELVEETLLLVGREARATLVTVQLDVGLDAKPAVGDRVQIQQVLMNLIMNGIQAMRDVEGRHREMHIAIEKASDTTVSLSVSDSGTGIAQDHISRIFEPFFTTKSEGMGMGLSICRAIIEAQGGTISVANNHGFGATVALSLPTVSPQA